MFQSAVAEIFANTMQRLLVTVWGTTTDAVVAVELVPVEIGLASATALMLALNNNFTL
jgi:hypothetical protein